MDLLHPGTGHGFLPPRVQVSKAEGRGVGGSSSGGSGIRSSSCFMASTKVEGWGPSRTYTIEANSWCATEL